MNDPQNIWQNQPTEAFKMSADQLTRKAVRCQRQAIKNDFFNCDRAGAMCDFALGCARTQETILRVGFGVLSAWCLYFGSQAYKWIWPRASAPGVEGKTTLEAYRSELEQRRDYVRHIWRRAGLTFCFLGVALVVIPGVLKFLHTPKQLLSFVPLFALIALWCALFFPSRVRRQRKLQREIDELTRFQS